MRLVLISIFSVLAVAVALVTLRLYGLSQNHISLSHPFIEKLRTEKPIKIAYRGLSSQYPGNTRKALQAAYNKNPKVIFFVDVYQSQDKKLVLISSADLQENTQSKGQVREVTFREIQKLQPTWPKGSLLPPEKTKFITLNTALKKFPQSFFILNIQANEKGIHRNLVKTIEDQDAGERILIQSDYDVILDAVRKLKPRWLFGSGQTERTKLKLLKDLYIETIAPVKADVVITPIYFKKTKQRYFGQELITEMQRRQKIVILGPVLNREDEEKLTQEGADGLLIP